MLPVSRFFRDDNTTPDNDRTDPVRDRFGSVRDQGVRSAENTREQFGDREYRVHEKAEHRRPDAALETSGLHRNVSLKTASPDAAPSLRQHRHDRLLRVQAILGLVEDR